LLFSISTEAGGGQGGCSGEWVLVFIAVAVDIVVVIVVVVQLEIPDAPPFNSPPCILLHPSTSLSPSDFESKWLNLSVV